MTMTLTPKKTMLPILFNSVINQVSLPKNDKISLEWFRKKCILRIFEKSNVKYAICWKSCYGSIMLWSSFLYPISSGDLQAFYAFYSRAKWTGNPWSVFLYPQTLSFILSSHQLTRYVWCNRKNKILQAVYNR
jgi:hypothetical protein